MDTLNPSQILVVPIVYRPLVVCFISYFPALVVRVGCRAILALVLKGTSEMSSWSYMNSTMVFIECLTRSSLLNPWL